MGFLAHIFGAKRAESVVLIDINADSVAGAYAYYKEKQLPTVLYTRRFPIEKRAGEAEEKALLRALKILSDTLVREGAPLLVRFAGDGRVHRILLSLSAPWQKTSLRTELFEQKTPFTFTRHLVSAALEKAGVPPSGHLRADESIIGTALNGYETRDPYGKHAHRASVVILASFVAEKVMQGVCSILREIYRVKDIVPLAGSSLRYQAIRRLFPHERDALILDATGQSSSIAVVRGGLLVDMVELSAPTTDLLIWQKRIFDECSRLAKKFPLPRTIFLLARAPDLMVLRDALDSASPGTLWLSDNPPTIVPILPSHTSEFVRRTNDASPDTTLLLMALFYKARKEVED